MIIVGSIKGTYSYTKLAFFLTEIGIRPSNPFENPMIKISYQSFSNRL